MNDEIEITTDMLLALTATTRDHLMIVGADGAASSVRRLARELLLAWGELNEARAEIDRLRGAA